LWKGGEPEVFGIGKKKRQGGSKKKDEKACCGLKKGVRVVAFSPSKRPNFLVDGTKRLGGGTDRQSGRGGYEGEASEEVQDVEEG